MFPYCSQFQVRSSKKAAGVKLAIYVRISTADVLRPIVQAD
jgi:hypothetical protein